MDDGTPPVAYAVGVLVWNTPLGTAKNVKEKRKEKARKERKKQEEKEKRTHKGQRKMTEVATSSLFYCLYHVFIEHVEVLI